MVKTVIFIVIVFLLLGCEETLEPEFESKLVVNAELKAGRGIDSVFVSWTAEITERFDTGAQRATGATVKINHIQLAEYPTAPGVYYLPDPTFVVQSGQTYNLEIIAGEELVTSSTTAPEPFQFLAEGIQNGDTMQYVPGTSWFSPAFFILTWYNYPGALVYRIVSDADSANKNTFIEDDRDEANVFKGDPEDRTNPAIWWASDNFARINWMFFNYSGWHTVSVSAMDDNYYQYRSGLNFNQFNGQNFNQIIKNGYGVFTSSSSDSIRIYVVAE
jgi:hypothetical protein